MKKVLFTTPMIKHPPAGGPYLRIENSIKALNKICELHVLSRVPINLIGGDAAQKFFQKNSHVFLYAPSTKENNFFVKILNKFSEKFCNLFFKSKIDQDAAFISKYIKKYKIDVVWFGYGNISFDLMKKVRQVNPDFKIVCDTDSVWSRYILRELPYAESEEKKVEIINNGSLKEKEERAWVEFCDVTTAVSDVDLQYYKSISVDSAKIKLFSNVIDLNNYNADLYKSKSIIKPAIYLAGTFGPKSPMDNAARWFINKVLPLIKDQVKNVHCYFIGKDADKVLADIKDDSITIKGEVDSVLPYLCNSDVAIVPLWFESGTRFKILEAGVCAVPVVSTTLGAEGIEAKNGIDLLIADEPQKFAESVILLLNDKNLAVKLGQNLNNLIKQKYSLEVLQKEGLNILNFL